MARAYDPVLRELESEIEAELFGEFESASACPAFTPAPVENPGGGRVKDKRPPQASDLVHVSRAFGGKVPLHRLAAAALDALQCAARDDGIRPPLLQPTSGFRNPKRQAEIWAAALRKYGSPQEARKWVAPPGSSAHQSGRAIDFYLGGKNSSRNVPNLRKLRAYHWLLANARRFGFYPYEREPWHWEYNPPASGYSELFPELFEPELFEFEGEFEDEGIGPVYREFAGEAPQFETGASLVTAAPKLIGQEVSPPGRTIYVNIPLGAEQPAKPMTGIFIPQHFRPQPQVDLIMYLHGIKPKADLTIHRYWDRNHFPTWPLREGLNQSGKNFILVAPTLGPRSQTQTGWLTKPGGLDKYMDQVLAALAAYGPYQRSGRQPRVGHIILACHSGGGLPMRKLAMGQNHYADRIKECWGFDCLYFTGDEDLWPQWARSRPDARLFIHYQSSTRLRSEKLKRKQVPNILVARSAAKGHNWVPIHHWQERLGTALQTRLPVVGARSNQEWERKIGLSSPITFDEMEEEAGPRDREVRETLAMAAKQAPGLGITIEELLLRHKADSGGIPIEALLAFLHYEAGARLFDDATAGYWDKKSKRYIPIPRFYELGVFQTPAGYHGCVPEGDKGDKRRCKYKPPGYNVRESQFGKGWYRLTKTYPTETNWKDPTMQVRIGLWDLNSTGERIADAFPELFPSRRSEWYLRMAVLYSFSKGAGWTRAYLSKYKKELLALPESQRWDFLRGKPAYLKGYGTKPKFDPENVDKKMALAAKLRAVRGATVTQPSAPRTPTTTDRQDRIIFGLDTASVGGNRNPNWAQAKAEGSINFAIIRSNWGVSEDSVFKRDWPKIKEASIVRGAYLFLRFPHPKYDMKAPDPVSQAKALIKTVGNLYESDFPPTVDVEFPGGRQLTGMTAKECLAGVRAAWKILRDYYGVAPIIYTSARVWKKYLDNLRVPDLIESPLWLARYPFKKGPAVRDARVFRLNPPPVPPPWGDATNWWIHQYQGDAVQLPGFPTGNVDMNRFNTMRRGATGDRVKWVQRRLGIAQNGQFDAAMDGVLRAFQDKKGLVSNGSVDPRTFAYLCWSNP